VVYSLDDEGKYQKTSDFTSDQVLSTDLFPGLEIKLEDVFKNSR
jgi:Uma2 family endonuclease